MKGRMVVMFISFRNFNGGQGGVRTFIRGLHEDPSR